MLMLASFGQTRHTHDENRRAAEGSGDTIGIVNPVSAEGYSNPLLSTSVGSRTSLFRWDSERGAFNCTSTLFADRAMS
jgi:hypothetical protein